MTEWQECSKSCGKGSQARFLLCRRQVNETFHEILVNSSCNVTVKPTDSDPYFRLCNEMSCPPQWQPLPWSEVDCKTKSRRMPWIKSMVFILIRKHFRGGGICKGGLRMGVGRGLYKGGEEAKT